MRTYLPKNFVSALGFIILISIFVLCCAFGSHAAYVAMIASLIGLLLAFNGAEIVQILRLRWVQMFLVAYLLIAIALIANADTTRDALSVFDFLPLALVVPAGLIFRQMAHENAIMLLAKLCLLGAVLALAIAFYSYYVLHEMRPHGIENSTIHFAYYALILGFLSLAGFFLPGKRPSFIFLAGPVIGVLAAFMTQSRGAVVVLVALLAVLSGFYVLRTRSSIIRKLSIIGAFALSIIAFIWGAHFLGASRSFAVFLNPGDVFRDVWSADASIAVRLDHMTGGFAAFLDAPIFGYGWRDQMQAALPYMSEFTQNSYKSEPWAYLHNELISLAVSAGIFGVAGYVLIFLAPIVGILTSARDSQFVARAYAVAIITAGFIAGGLTEVLFKYEMPKAFLVFSIAAFLFCCTDNASPKQRSN